MIADYYKTLGLTKGATLDDVKQAYRNLALKTHPLRHKVPNAKQQFLQVSESFDVLSDAKKRAVYDRYGSSGLTQGVTDGYEGESFPGGYNLAPSQADSIFSKFFGGSNPYDDLYAPNSFTDDGLHIQGPAAKTRMLDGGVAVKEYGSAFGGMLGMAEHARGAIATPQHPPALEIPLPLTLEELYNGALKKVQVQRKILNPDGKTTTLKEKQFSVEVKKGWKAGTKIVFQREGNQGPNQVPGDVVFVVEERKHALYERKGANLTHCKTLSLKEALTGTIIALPTLDDRTIFIPVNEVARPGFSKTVLGEGMPKSKTPSVRGDLLITFQVEFPAYLTEEQKHGIKKILS